jgi:hypothetical protein
MISETDTGSEELVVSIEEVDMDVTIQFEPIPVTARSKA